jgi:hypothetical protein
MERAKGLGKRLNNIDVDSFLTHHSSTHKASWNNSLIGTIMSSTRKNIYSDDVIRVTEKNTMKYIDGP